MPIRFGVWRRQFCRIITLVGGELKCIFRFPFQSASSESLPSKVLFGNLFPVLLAQQRYAYLLELEATGEDHDLLFMDAKGSAERCEELGRKTFYRKAATSYNRFPVPIVGFIKPTCRNS